MVDVLLELDGWLLRQAGALHATGATAVFALISAWWVKGPLLMALGLLADVGRRRLPIAFAAAVTAGLTGSLLAGALKDLFDRPRPGIADPRIESLVGIPTNPSFPSGHSLTAFAAATAIAVICPRLRWWALGLAAAVALSRIYLQVHYPLDVLVGSALGVGVGLLSAFVVLSVCRRAGFPLGRRAEPAAV